MQLYNTFLFVGAGDSPDDRSVTWVPGHADKVEFSAKAGCLATEVKHAFADSADTAPDADGPSWWSEEKTDDCNVAITFKFD